MGCSSSKSQTRFESLNDDTLTTVLEFVGNKSYRSFGGVNKRCKEVYLNTPGMTKETFLYSYAPLWAIKVRIERAIEDDWRVRCGVGDGVVYHNRRDVLDLALQQQRKYVLQEICYISAGEGRIDLLNYVWNNEYVYDRDKSFIFRVGDGYIARHAVIHGKLNVLKWYETKGLFLDKRSRAQEAARYGHIHIIQWLKEEKGLELNRGFVCDGELYFCAIVGDQLHVMKWLREQEVYWNECTFSLAAELGNLDILQWLHDEGCPWPDGVHIDEEGRKPEVIDWLHRNGYGDRISV